MEMKSLVETDQDFVWVIVVGLPVGAGDEDGVFVPTTGNEDFVTAATRGLTSIVQHGQYKDKAGMIRYIQSNSDESIRHMIGTGNLIIVYSVDGDWTVFSKHHRAKMPKLLKRASVARKFEDDTVAWAPNIDAEPVPTTIGTVFGGKSPLVDKTASPASQKELGPRAKAELRQKFWGTGGASPKGVPGEWSQPHAEEIVNKLLQ